MKKFFRPFDYKQAVTPPLVALYESPEDIAFKMDLPGISPEDISVKVYEDILIVEGEARGSWTRPQCFRRVLRLPVAVNTHAGRARYKDGVLIITFPKVLDRVIKIKIENTEE